MALKARSLGPGRVYKHIPRHGQLVVFRPPPARRTLLAALAAAIARRSRRRLLHARWLLGGKLRTRGHPLQPRGVIPKLAILGLDLFVVASPSGTALCH